MRRKVFGMCSLVFENQVFRVREFREVNANLFSVLMNYKERPTLFPSVLASASQVMRVLIF